MNYFDHNATTPLHPAARDAWLAAVDEHWQNPSSPYRSAARARNALEEARKRLAIRLKCPVERIVFTAGATEANNAVLRHIAGRPGRVLVSAIEHPCVLEPARKLFGDRLDILPVGERGRVSAAAIRQRLEGGERPALVSVMAVNNETGLIQPWRELAVLCRKHGVPYHCDAAQWVGRRALSGVAQCDFVTASAHKFGGPKGTGFLVIPQDANDFHAQFGGSQEHGRRGGTENLPAILAMVAAFEAADDWVREHMAVSELDDEEAVFHDLYDNPMSGAWRDAFAREVMEAIPGARLVGSALPSTPSAEARLWNTAMLIMPRHANTRWVARLDKAGFEISTGSACATGREGPSHVLAAMGLDEDAARRAVRISSGPDTPQSHWEALATAFAEVWAGLEAEPANEVIEV